MGTTVNILMDSNNLKIILKNLLFVNIENNVWVKIANFYIN